MKRTYTHLIIAYFICTWIVMGFLAYHYANHDHPQPQVIVVDYQDKLTEVLTKANKAIEVARNLRDDAEFALKVTDSITLDIEIWNDKMNIEFKQLAAAIEKAQKTADEALRRTKQGGCR